MSQFQLKALEKTAHRAIVTALDKTRPSMGVRPVASADRERLGVSTLEVLPIGFGPGLPRSGALLTSPNDPPGVAYFVLRSKPQTNVEHLSFGVRIWLPSVAAPDYPILLGVHTWSGDLFSFVHHQYFYPIDPDETSRGFQISTTGLYVPMEERFANDIVARRMKLKNLLDTPLKELMKDESHPSLSLGPHTEGVLRRSGIVYLGDLVLRSASDLRSQLNSSNMGSIAIFLLKLESLFGISLHLGMKLPDWKRPEES